MIVTHSTKPVATGSLIGLVVAAAVSLLFAAGIPEMETRDPLSYAGVILLIVITAFLASLMPARRAASINPVEALRAE
jgi:ABC-type antimicrobial peptide transport system permease subunit